MQGRLVPSEDHRIQSFPARRWRDEFPRAAGLGVAAIEWIYERFGAEANPIRAPESWAEVRALVAQWRVAVPSVCADILMDEPVVRVPVPAAEHAGEHVVWLMDRAVEAGVERLVLPFVGGNALETAEEMWEAASYITAWAAAAEARGLELHLETSLGPKDQAALLSRVPSRAVKVTYDIGNSVILGYDVREELAAYGDRVGSVHVKDALHGGTTVPLGAGHADLTYCFDRLAQLRYAGPYILQAARVSGEDDAVTVAGYVSFVRQRLAAAGEQRNDGTGACR